MPLTRRDFFLRSSASLAAGALAPLLANSEQTKQDAPNHYHDWKTVRREFDLAPDYIHLGLFYIASHPRPVRETIERYRRQLDANPFTTVESGLFEDTEQNIGVKVCQTIANYIGGNAQDIAITQNTTTG